MLDFARWIERAKELTVGLARLGGELSTEVSIDSPLTASEFARLQADLPSPLPASLEAFLLEGSAKCAFSYVWTPSPEAIPAFEAVFPDESSLYGGAMLCDACAMPGYWTSCQSWGTDSSISEFPVDQALWLNAVPFASIRNGDYLALDMSSASSDPPVVYLSHDDNSDLIAPTFEAFLGSWERLCYIGPELWLLEPFRDPESGFLNLDTAAAQQLRRLFGMVNP